jgi:hypothetical protein
MTHLEQLVYEYYDWLGYLVKHNIKVGRLQEEQVPAVWEYFMNPVFGSVQA